MTSGPGPCSWQDRRRTDLGHQAPPPSPTPDHPLPVSLAICRSFASSCAWSRHTTRPQRSAFSTLRRSPPTPWRPSSRTRSRRALWLGTVPIHIRMSTSADCHPLCLTVPCRARTVSTGIATSISRHCTMSACSSATGVSDHHQSSLALKKKNTDCCRSPRRLLLPIRLCIVAGGMLLFAIMFAIAFFLRPAAKLVVALVAVWLSCSPNNTIPLSDTACSSEPSTGWPKPIVSYLRVQHPPSIHSPHFIAHPPPPQSGRGVP